MELIILIFLTKAIKSNEHKKLIGHHKIIIKFVEKYFILIHFTIINILIDAIFILDKY